VLVIAIMYQLDKLERSPGLITGGHWRVKYGEGAYSQRMTYEICCDYAEMYDGTVVWCRYFDPGRKHNEA
jgi:hypothetical protein